MHENNKNKIMHDIKNKHNNKFNIYVVEDHNDALAEIYKEIRAKRLSFSNLVLIHFDSHPDLGIPNLNADLVYETDKLFEGLSIENWILPAVYANHINEIVWIKPKWSNQINAGLYNFTVGKDSVSGFIKVNSREKYFISDTFYASEANLTNKRELKLYVCDFEAILNENDEYLNKLFDSLKTEDKRAILDIDLDFFSTMDPFKRMFPSDDDYGVFKSVYKIVPNFSIKDPEFDDKYTQFNLEKSKKLAKIEQLLSQKEELDDSTDDSIKRLAKIIKQNSLDVEILHSYGSGVDDLGLPDHVSTNDEIKSMLDQFDSFLCKYFSNKLKPNLITIARSSLDDYCPPEQVNFIQDETLNRINEFFKQDTAGKQNTFLNY